MKTLKEIHESQGEKFGYKVMNDRHEILEVIGYSITEQSFVLKQRDYTFFMVSESITYYKLLKKPREVWVNFYKSPDGVVKVCVGYMTEENAVNYEAPGVTSRVKFREVMDET